jgi:hypothetical protein
MVRLARQELWVQPELWVQLELWARPGRRVLLVLQALWVPPAPLASVVQLVSTEKWAPKASKVLKDLRDSSER